MSTLRTTAAVGRKGGALGARATSLPHLLFVLGEGLLLLLFALLTLAVHVHPGPLTGDAVWATDLQHALRPHRTISDLMDFVSTIAWPIPSAITVVAFTLLFLALRRWLDAIMVLVLPGIANGVNFLIGQAIHRPRPSGHGLYIAQHVTASYSFPSGHVLQGVTFFGFVLFLSFILIKPAPWLWPARIVLAVVILVMGPSRVLAGEHWPSDVLGAWLSGIFWVLVAAHVYAWVGRRWPRVRGHSPSVGEVEAVRFGR